MGYGVRMNDLSLPACRVCGASAGFRSVLDIPGLLVVRCPVCGLVFEVLEGQGETDVGYDNIYPRSPSSGRPRRGLRRRFGIWESRLKAAPGSRVLEVGCSYGFFVEYLVERGWRAQGVDVSANAVSYARGRGLSCRCLRIEDFPPGETFDAVVMIHVLEHLPRPVEMLKFVSTLLEPAGIVYIRVPNLASRLVNRGRTALLGHLKPREHLSYFTPETLTRALGAAGFSAEVGVEGRNSWADLANSRLRSRLVSSQAWRDFNYRTPLQEKNLYTFFKTLYENHLLRFLSAFPCGGEDREVVAVGRKRKENSEPATE